MVKTTQVVEETIGTTLMGIKEQWEVQDNSNHNNARATKETTISTITSAAQQSAYNKMMAVWVAGFLPWRIVQMLVSSWLRAHVFTMISPQQVDCKSNVLDTL